MNELVYEQTQIKNNQEAPVILSRSLNIPNLSDASTGDWRMVGQGGSLPVPNMQPRPTRAARPNSLNDMGTIDWNTFVDDDLKRRGGHTAILFE